MARLAQMFSEDVTSRQEAGAAADAPAFAPDHDVGVLGAPARSNATPPFDGASEETLCKRQRTSRGPTGGSAISMPDLGRSDNASATGTPAWDGPNSPHSLGDSIHPVPFTQPDTNTSLSLCAGRDRVSRFRNFGDRVSVIKYLLELNYLTHGPDDRLIRNHTKPRHVHLPFIEGNPKVAVESVIAWHKKSLPTEEDWEGMRADPDLKKKLGEGWFFVRSRVPRTWIHKLNQRCSGAGATA